MENNSHNCFYHNKVVNQLINQNISAHKEKFIRELSNYKKEERSKIIDPLSFCEFLEIGVKKSPILKKNFDCYSFSVYEIGNHFSIYYDKDSYGNEIKYMIILQAIYIYFVKQYKHMLKFRDVFAIIDDNIFYDVDDKIFRFCDFTAFSSLIPIEEFRYLYTEFGAEYVSKHFNFNITLMEKYINYIDEMMPDNNLDGMYIKKKNSGNQQ